MQSLVEDAEQLKPSYISGRSVNWYNYFETLLHQHLLKYMLYPMTQQFPRDTNARERESHSVMSHFLWLYSPWNSPGQNTEVGSHSLLQGILPPQGSNPGLPCCKQMLYQLSHHGSQRMHRSLKTMVPNLSGTRHEFCGNNFSMDWVVLRVLWGWYKHIPFIVHCISIIITSAPPQIIRH